MFQYILLLMNENLFNMKNYFFLPSLLRMLNPRRIVIRGSRLKKTVW